MLAKYYALSDNLARVSLTAETITKIINMSLLTGR